MYFKALGQFLWRFVVWFDEEGESEHWNLCNKEKNKHSLVAKASWKYLQKFANFRC